MSCWSVAFGAFRGNAKGAGDGHAHHDSPPDSSRTPPVTRTWVRTLRSSGLLQRIFRGRSNFFVEQLL